MDGWCLRGRLGVHLEDDCWQFGGSSWRRSVTVTVMAVGRYITVERGTVHLLQKKKQKQKKKKR